MSARHHCVCMPTYCRLCSCMSFSPSPFSVLPCICFVRVFWLRAWLYHLQCCLASVSFCLGLGAIQLGSCLSDNSLLPLLVFLAVRITLDPAMKRFSLSSLGLWTRDGLEGSGWGGRQVHWSIRPIPRLSLEWPGNETMLALYLGPQVCLFHLSHCLCPAFSSSGLETHLQLWGKGRKRSNNSYIARYLGNITEKRDTSKILICCLGNGYDQVPMFFGAHSFISSSMFWNTLLVHMAAVWNLLLSQRIFSNLSYR